MRLSERFEVIEVLKTVAVSFLIFNVAMIFPLTSFIFPVYKIRANQKLNQKQIFIVNTALFLLIGFVSKMTLMLYVSLFLVIEVLYYMFETLQTKMKIKIFDRIIITSIVSTVLMILFLGQASDTLEVLKKTITDVYTNQYGIITDVYTNQYGISQRDLSMIFNYATKYRIFLLYIYTGAIAYFSYLILKKKEYKDWKISYQWIIIYIIAFFVSRYAGFGKVISVNTLAILKITYALYGIKLIYNLINSKINNSIISQMGALAVGFYFSGITFIIAILKITYALYGIKLIYNLINSKINNSIISQMGALAVGFYFSGITFIIGALECFDFIKIHIVKLNNGGKR